MLSSIVTKRCELGIQAVPANLRGLGFVESENLKAALQFRVSGIRVYSIQEHVCSETLTQLPTAHHRESTVQSKQRP